MKAFSQLQHIGKKHVTRISSQDKNGVGMYLPCVACVLQHSKRCSFLGHAFIFQGNEALHRNRFDEANLDRSRRFMITPPKMNMSPEKGPSEKDISFANHQFSGGFVSF